MQFNFLTIANCVMALLVSQAVAQTTFAECCGSTYYTHLGTRPPRTCLYLLLGWNSVAWITFTWIDTNETV